MKDKLTQALKNHRAKLHSIRNEQGAAISLGEIMVAIVVTAVLVGIILTILFGLIPWSQDHVAKNNLAQITVAQETHQARTIGGAGTGWTFGNLLTETDPLTEYIPYEPEKYCSVIDTAEGQTYVSYAVSGSGKVFTNNSANLAPTETTLTAAQADCPELIGTETEVADALNPWNIEDPLLKNQIASIVGVSPAGLSLDHAETFGMELAWTEEYADAAEWEAMFGEPMTCAIYEDGHGHGTLWWGHDAGDCYENADGSITIDVFFPTPTPLSFNGVTTAKGLELAPNLTQLTAADHFAGLNFNSLQDSRGFENITEMTGMVLLDQNTTISDYSGFGNINYIEWLYFAPARSNMTGFENLESVGQLTYGNRKVTPVVHNPNFTGFQSLTFIRDFFFETNEYTHFPNGIFSTPNNPWGMDGWTGAELGGLAVSDTPLIAFPNLTNVSLVEKWDEGLNGKIGSYVFVLNNANLTNTPVFGAEASNLGDASFIFDNNPNATGNLHVPAGMVDIQIRDNGPLNITGLDALRGNSGEVERIIVYGATSAAPTHHPLLAPLDLSSPHVWKAGQIRVVLNAFDGTLPEILPNAFPNLVEYEEFIVEARP